MQNGYFWPEIAKNYKQYTTKYGICRRTKAYTIQKQGLLNSLPIPNQKWIGLSLNFVVNLSKCRCRNQTLQHILIIVNRLTKQYLYEPLETLKTAKFINAMYKKVFATYRFLLTIMNDKSGQITSIL